MRKTRPNPPPYLCVSFSIWVAKLSTFPELGEVASNFGLNYTKSNVWEATVLPGQPGKEGRLASWRRPDRTGNQRVPQEGAATASLAGGSWPGRGFAQAGESPASEHACQGCGGHSGALWTRAQAHRLRPSGQFPKARVGLGKCAKWAKGTAGRRRAARPPPGLPRCPLRAQQGLPPVLPKPKWRLSFLVLQMHRRPGFP